MRLYEALFFRPTRESLVALLLWVFVHRLVLVEMLQVLWYIFPIPPCRLLGLGVLLQGLQGSQMFCRK